jgi:3-hydroxybutyrate dehydrogenase
MKKCAIVTGGASGIGKAVAEALSRQNHDVVIADMDEENGRSVAEEVGGCFVRAVLTEEQSCRGVVEAAAAEYGRIDILVNNAGFQHVSPLDEFPEDKWNDMLSVMLTAPFLLTKYAWPYMQGRKWGRVVNMASIHGMVASPYKAGYVAAKHGLVGFTRTAALEGGRFGITVNAICPGYVRTPLVEKQIADQARFHKIAEDEVIEHIMLKSAAVKRIIEPKEIADLVSWLCTDSGACITGACLAIDCGWTAQ